MRLINICMCLDDQVLGLIKVQKNLITGSLNNQHGKSGLDTHALGFVCLSISIDLCFLKEQLRRHQC